MSGFCNNKRRLLQLSNIGLIAALSQTVIMVWQVVNTNQNWGIWVCLSISLVVAFCYLRYLRGIQRPSEAFSHSTSKYFLIAHLLIATWYFWIALAIFICHNGGLQFFASFSSGGIDGAPLSLLSSIFFITVLSHILDGVVIYAHGRAIIEPKPISVFLKVTACSTVFIDVGLVACSVSSYKLQGDRGTIVLIVLGVISLLLQARHAWGLLFSPIFPDHEAAQMLHLQHELICSTIFLVNMLLLALKGLGTTFAEVIEDANVAPSIILSGVAYFGILVSTILLVGMHSTLAEAEGGEGGRGGRNDIAAATCDAMARRMLDNSDVLIVAAPEYGHQQGAGGGSYSIITLDAPPAAIGRESSNYIMT